MATGQCPSRMSGAFTVNSQTSQIIRVGLGPRKSWKDNIKEWMDQLMSSLLRITDDRNRWAAITAEASVGVPTTTP